jgi:hypothetical protein
MKLGSWFALALTSLLTFAPAQARAASPADKAGDQHVVVLLPIESEGLIPSDSAELEQRLRLVFEYPQIRLITPREAASCSDEPCLIQLGRELGAKHVVRTKVVADGRDYVAQVDVLLVEDGALFDTIDASCRICGLAEFDDRLAARTVIARDWILTTPLVGRLRLEGGPHEARVRVDGRWRGQLPYSGDLSVGRHQLVVSSSGYFSRTLPIETLAGVEQRLAIELEPKPIQRWHRGVGWATLGVGLGSLTAGAILIGADQQATGRTIGAGVGLAVLGAAATTVGASLLVIDSRRRLAHGQLRGQVGLGRIDLWLRF